MCKITLVDNSVLTSHFGDVRVRGNTKITGSLDERKIHDRMTFNLQTRPEVSNPFKKYRLKSKVKFTFTHHSNRKLQAKSSPTNHQRQHTKETNATEKTKCKTVLNTLKLEI